MLTQREKEGLKAILEKLDNHDLISLVGTTTKGMIKPETRDEAMSIILMYSDTALALLRRRKIKKEILFHYLKDNNVSTPPSAEKAKLVIACLKLWQSYTDAFECAMENLEDTDETNSPTAPEIPSYNDGNILMQSTMQDVILQQQVAVEGNHVVNDLEKMGREFVAWFYGLLNNININSRSFHSDHFWPDCVMHLQVSATVQQLLILGAQNITSNTEELTKVHTEQILGAQNVTDILVRLILMGQFIFHPNASHYGVSCFIERHGLVKIFASGVLHNGNNCVGVFDQVFGLVRSPNTEDNWKIKYTELLLKLKHKNVQILQ